MTNNRLIEAIGRIERAVTRIERTELSAKNLSTPTDTDLIVKHEQLKTETAAAIRQIDQLINSGTA
jgi:hypothetical protein